MYLREACEKCRNSIHSLTPKQKKAINKAIQKIIRYTISVFVSIFLIVIFLFILQQVPQWEVAKFGMTNPKDLAEIENSYRATLAQILGGIAIGIGLYYTWRRVIIAEKELKISQEGQITERFTRAVDQLGRKELEIKLGGIYALERIANESDKDYWPIMEILTAYVRMHSNVKVTENKNDTPTSMEVQVNENATTEDQEVGTIPLDIQAVLTVLTRRRYSIDSGETEELNLKEVYLQKAELVDYHLEGANLEKAHLEETNLMFTHFKGACLKYAHLEEATLIHTYFENADLRWAHLEGVHGTHVSLNGTDMSQAHLEKANLFESQLQGTRLEGAYLQDTGLSMSHFEGANLQNAHLEGAKLNEAYLKGAYCRGANFEGTDFLKADLKGTYGLSFDQLSKVKTLYKAKLNPKLEKPLREKYPDLFDEPKVEP
jgi:uncharacterized protein YjbI with pentapeptide repeats